MRPIDADALAHDLEYDVEQCARALDDMNMVGKERDDMQWEKDCKQNCIWYISEQPTVDAIPIEAIVERIENENAETYDRYVLAELYMEWRHENDRFDEDDRFNDLPPLEERLPVRHAKWVYEGKLYYSDNNTHNTWSCSGCGCSEFTLTRFCPNCGAMMVEE